MAAPFGAVSAPDPTPLPPGGKGRGANGPERGALNPQATQKRTRPIDEQELIQYLRTLLNEAKTAAENGPERRKDQWRLNWEAYWARYDIGDKADWQAAERLPDVAQNVERFTAAMRKALVAAGLDWYTFEDPRRRDQTLGSLVQLILDVFLGRSGTNPMTGHPTSFGPTFSQAVKNAALGFPALGVGWEGGRLKIEPIDWRELYFDPSGRVLYRFREYEMDIGQLWAMKGLTDAEGKRVYKNLDAVSPAVGSAWEDREDKARAAGHSKEVDDHVRKTVQVQEFYGWILDADGKRVHDEKQLVVMVDEREIIRGPEPNPFWHKEDWIVAAPTLQVTGSVYGRTYVESFEQLAHTFIDMTNLILDAIAATAMNAYQAWPGAMDDESQLNDGVSPQKVFLADDDAEVGKKFIERLETGRLDQAAVTVWEGIRGLLRDAAGQNELRLGSLANKSEVTATEINTADEGSEAMVEHIATDIEQMLLTPMLNIAWATVVQHLDVDVDEKIRAELPPAVIEAVTNQREDFRQRTIHLKAGGISHVIQRNRDRMALMAFLQAITQSPELMEQYKERFSPSRTLDELMRTFGIDAAALHKTPSEIAEDKIQQRQQALQEVQNAAAGGAGGSQNLLGRLGNARQSLRQARPPTGGV